MTMSLLERWLDMVALSGDRRAVRTSRGDLTFSSLEERSRKLASCLRRYRGRDALIALPFGPGFYVALHACMRSGVTSLPMDLTVPREMFTGQLQRLDYSCVISERDIASALDIPMGIELVSEGMDEGPGDDWVEGCQVSGEGLLALPLYRLFTSGSSGQQTLVTVNHETLAKYSIPRTPSDVDASKEVANCCAGSHVSSFQISSFWGSVMSGITYVPIDPKAEGISVSAEHLLSVQPDALAGFPSLLGELFAAMGQDGIQLNINSLAIVGEPLKPVWMSKCMEVLPSLKKVSYTYSSTEAMRIAKWSGTPEEFLAFERIPVGYPEADKEVSIVDDGGAPVPVGEIGEIVVRSAHICSDIQGRDSHLRLEHEASGGFRTYRTGDLGRFRPDGMMEYIGRLDRQIKINGVRIDPLIVEQCMEAQEGVEACIVSAVEMNGNTCLAAAYTSQMDVETENFRVHLNSLLPLSHQPSVFLRFDSLPKTERGKPALAIIDRMVRERLNLDAGKEGLPLSTPTELRLAGLWSELLGVEVRSRDADFFRLGGHSLIAMRLSGRIRKEYDVTVTLPEIFSDGHLGRLAARIDTERRLRTVEDKGGMSGLGFLQPIPSVTQELQDVSTDGSVYPASHMQEALWRLDLSQTGILWVRIPTIMYRMHGRLDMAALQYALDMLMASQPALRTVFFERGGELFQEVKEQMHVPLERSDGKDCSIQELLPTDEFLTRPFDMANGPLIRAEVISLDGETHYLRIIIHHIVWDAYSTPLILRELSRCYNGFKAGEPVTPVLHGQGQGEYAQAERRWLQTDGGKASLRYWMGRLDLGGLGHPWPFAELRGSVSGSGQAENGPVEYVLSPELSSRIRSFSARRSSSVFRFLMGSYVMTLQGLLPGRAVTVGMVVNMRRTSEELGLVGCLINTLPVTIAAHGPQTIEAYLALSDRQIDDAFRHDRVPGGLALKEWVIRRGINRHLAPNTLFNFIEAGQDAVNFEGLTTARVRFGKSSPTRDLNIRSNSFSSHGKDGPIRLFVSFKEESLCREQVVSLLDVWTSVMRHCTDGEAFEVSGAVEFSERICAFAGGAGGFDEHAKIHRIGECLGDDVSMQVLPDPEASFGLLPGMGLPELAKGYAERIMQTGSKDKVWLMGEGLGALDAFATACALQRLGVADVGLILVDPLVPNPAEKFYDHRSAAMEAYERMPERGSPLQEWLFDIRLRAATRGLLRILSHPVPKSKYQVFRAALAYGLFDAEFYKARYGEDGEAAIEVSWLRYLAGGWRSGQYPSERFHAYRYERSVVGFVAGGDEPVLHALLFGMRRSETRRRILECLGSPLELSEIALVRKRLRLQAFDPGIFRGDVHVLIGGVEDQNGIELTWKGLVQGKLDIYILDRPFSERIEKVAEKLGSILTDFRLKNQGS